MDGRISAPRSAAFTPGGLALQRRSKLLCDIMSRLQQGADNRFGIRRTDVPSTRHAATTYCGTKNIQFFILILYFYIYLFTDSPIREIIQTKQRNYSNITVLFGNIGKRYLFICLSSPKFISRFIYARIKQVLCENLKYSRSCCQSEKGS